MRTFAEASRAALAIGSLAIPLAALVVSCVGDDPAASSASILDAATDQSSATSESDSGSDGGGEQKPPPPAVLDKISWANYVATQGVDGARVAMDPNGYSVVAQQYVGSAPELPEAPYSGLYIARLDSAGKAVWKKGIPLQGTPPAVRSALGGVAVDAAGDIYVTGSTQATLDFGGGVVVTGNGQYKDIGFVVKLDRATGAGIWKSTFTSTSETHVADIAVRKESIAITGNFFETLSYESTTGPATAGPGYAAFVARLDRATGKAAWLSTATPTATVMHGGVTLDDDATIYAGFSFNGTMTGWGDPAPLGTGGTDGLLIAFDAGGTRRYTRQFGKNGNSTLCSVASVSYNAGTVAIVGRAPAGIDLGDGKPLGTSGGSDPWIATFEPSTGALRWARAVGNDYAGDDDEGLSGVAIDDWGQVIAVGRYRKSLVIDGKALPTPATELVTAAFGVKLDAKGAFVWSKAILASKWAHAESVAVGPNGTTVVGVALNGSFDLGAGVTGTTPTSNKAIGAVGWTP